MRKISLGSTGGWHIIPGIDSDDSLLLNGHFDTVGVEDVDAPFDLRQAGDKLYGRGTYDMKGSIAVMLLLADYVTRYPPPISILSTFAADEEDRIAGRKTCGTLLLVGLRPLRSGGDPFCFVRPHRTRRTRSG